MDELESKLGEKYPKIKEYNPKIKEAINIFIGTRDSREIADMWGAK